MGFLEGDQGAAELEQGEVVLVLLAPANEEAAVSVHPGVACFDDPPPGAPAGRVGLELDLLTAGANVRRQPVDSGELAGAVVVVAAVQAQPLRPLGGRLGPLDRDRVERRF